MARTFRPWDVDQVQLFPPTARDFVPDDQLTHFVRDTVRDELDLSAILETDTEERGYPPYHPVMMAALLLYAYCRGVFSSRRIARACRECVDFMAVTGGQTPDFRTISDFRKRHLKALEAEAEAETEKKRAARKDDEDGPKRGGRPPRTTPKDKAQRNFTDPESRIMKGPEGFTQAYNCPVAVDASSHVIVAQQVSNPSADRVQLKPMVAQIKANTGRQARELSADAGYCTEGNLEELSRRHIRGYVATGRRKHDDAVAQGLQRNAGPRAEAMRTRLRRGGFRSRYQLRKQTAEPVIGNVKVRGLRHFLLRGLANVAGEWSLACAAHNLLKLATARM